jgi:hypothetical protein
MMLVVDDECPLRMSRSGLRQGEGPRMRFPEPSQPVSVAVDDDDLLVHGDDLAACRRGRDLLHEP